MAEILPFIGTRYNSQLIGNLGKVVAPPYDAVSPEFVEELRNAFLEELQNKDSNNPLRLNVMQLELSQDLPEDNSISNKYTRAANKLYSWRSDGIMIEDERPSIYLYEQVYKLPNGEQVAQKGFFALVRIEDLLCKHKNRDDAPLSPSHKDRLKMMRKTRANLSPVWGVFEDPENEFLSIAGKRMEDRAWEEVVDADGNIHRLWVVQKKDILVGLRDLLKTRQVQVIDGLLRLEAAELFRNELRENTGKKDGKQPFDYIMLFLMPTTPGNLSTQASHRVFTKAFLSQVDLPDALEEIQDNFDVLTEKASLENPAELADQVVSKIQTASQKAPSLALVHANGTIHFLTLKNGVDLDELLDDEEVPPAVRHLDVTLLHHYLVNQVMIGNPEFELEEDECHFVRTATKALTMLKEKKGVLAVILNPPTVDDILKVVSSGTRLPRKTASLTPQILSGFVVRNMISELRRK